MANDNMGISRLRQNRSTSRYDAVWRGGTGIPPVNHAQDVRATLKLHHYPSFIYLMRTKDARAPLARKFAHRLERIDLVGIFVGPQTHDARKSQRIAALVAI